MVHLLTLPNALFVKRTYFRREEAYCCMILPTRRQQFCAAPNLIYRILMTFKLGQENPLKIGYPDNAGEA